jgi:hypothetical protein
LRKLDVIGIEVKKYSRNARKLTTKAGKRIKKHDVITSMHAMIER